MATEIWKDVVGWVGFYQVSNRGRVRSVTRIIKRRTHGKKFDVQWTGGLMKPANMSNGYQFVPLRKQGTIKSQQSIHRLVANAFVPNPKGRPCVNHKNGVKKDNRRSNLEWVNKSENALHAIKNNLVSCFAETHPMAKLKNRDIRKIRNSSLSYIKLGRIYGVSGTAIQHIKEGKTWKSVK